MEDDACGGVGTLMLAPAMRTISRRIPKMTKAVVRRWLFKDQHWANPVLRARGTIQDLYYWRCDPRLDTVIVMHNYFSVFFPHLETRTDGTVYVYDQDGGLLGTRSVTLPHQGFEKMRLSCLLEQFGRAGSRAGSEGTILFNLRVPSQVQHAVAPHGERFYFWHRFYIAYTVSGGQPAFVHCVDKTYVFNDMGMTPVRWYRRAGQYPWAPEMPVNILDYERFSVILMNRAPRQALVTLEVHDREGRLRAWSQEIPPDGVRRFELTPQLLSGLTPFELRMRIKGMPSPWGRPIVLKEFANGAISVMHC